MKKFFSVRAHAGEVDLVLLLLRIVCGYAFILHGWGKIQNPMGWMGPDAAIPGVFLALAAVAEFFGGIALIIGLFTHLAALGLVITMAVAVFMHAFLLGDPFVHPTGGAAFELGAVYLLVFLLFLVIGPGRFSADHKIFGSKGA